MHRINTGFAPSFVIPLFRRRGLLVTAALVACFASPSQTHADPIAVTYTETPNSTITPSTGDLLLGKSPVYNDDFGGATGTSANSSVKWIQDAGSTGIPALTDGAWTYNNKGTDASVGGNAGGQTLIYNFSSVNNIGLMRFYFGWNDSGRNNPCAIAIYVNPSTTVNSATDANWTLLTNAASPTGFTTNYYLQGTGIVANNPSGRGTAGNGNGTFVTINDTNADGAPFANNVGSIKLVFGNAENTYTGLGEVTAFVAPEPSVIGFASLLVVPLLRRRRNA